MAAFSTLALLGLAAAGGFAASKVLSKGPSSSDRTGRTTPGRTNPNAPPSLLGGPPPPDTTATASAATDTAKRAAERRRKRAGAGASILTGQPVAKDGPAATLQPKTLLGY